ncbi:MAG: hypothetical protein OEW75_07355 [Cyclobacteriaceae bacterium]|nr:hypothetical protein [Cyclobacteriaceae bacterium]
MDKAGIITLFDKHDFYLIPDKEEVKSKIIIEDTPAKISQPEEITSQKEVPEKVISEVVTEVNEVVNSEVTKEEIDQETIEITGTNKMGISVIVHYSGEVVPSDKELLTKILASVNVDIKNILLVNIHSFTGNKVDFSAKNLVFGHKTHDEYFPDAPFYSIHEHEGMQFLFSDELSALHDNRDLKLKLWEGLKKLFTPSVG